MPAFRFLAGRGDFPVPCLSPQLKLRRAEAGQGGRACRADEPRRNEALQVQLATAEADGSALTIETAELTAQLNQARRQAQEAQDAAEALRQAEANRRARGVLARLRAAWRRE
jgi:hypothetical protein